MQRPVGVCPHLLWVVTPPFLTPKEPSCTCARQGSFPWPQERSSYLFSRAQLLPLALSFECLNKNKSSILFHLTKTSCSVWGPIYFLPHLHCSFQGKFWESDECVLNRIFLRAYMVYGAGGGGLITKLCPTLATPWTIAWEASLSVGFPRQECWSGMPFSSPGSIPDPGIEPRSPALQAYSFYSLSHQGSSSCPQSLPASESFSMSQLFNSPTKNTFKKINNPNFWFYLIQNSNLILYCIAFLSLGLLKESD